MNKNNKKWEICRFCMEEKSKKLSNGILFAGIKSIIESYIVGKEKWINPVRLIGQNKRTKELCDNCEYKLEHEVIGQKIKRKK